MSKPSVHVAIAVLFHQGKVLVGWRNSHQHQGNKSEFPGGKVEQGETPEQACRREVREEVGMDIQHWHAFDLLQHDYDDIQVNLHLFHAVVPQQQLSRVQAPWAWYRREQLSGLNFPAANQAIIQRLQWPHYIKISDDLSAMQQLPEDTLLYWRNDQSSISADGVIHGVTHEITQSGNASVQQLILNIDHWKVLNPGQQLRIAAVHFKHSQLMAAAKGDLPVGIRCIAACHDQLSLARAQQLGFDAVLLSPVQGTATHTDAQVLGWGQFSTLAALCDIPVFALGGLKPADLQYAQQQHAYGVAGIRHF
ncbi:NUDIX domain-containing protein [Acinetobacter sp. WZC-1]|uniref:NUDIX domain-containing protein n=1 Tax=Acinetobacter sp. WZC-1 TaxID=3459034 RepID=UPI00403DFDE1